MLAAWKLKPILSACLRVCSYLSCGLRLKNYRQAPGNHKFISRFSVFAFVCVIHSNKVKVHLAPKMFFAKMNPLVI